MLETLVFVAVIIFTLAVWVPDLRQTAIRLIRDVLDFGLEAGEFIIQYGLWRFVGKLIIVIFSLGVLWMISFLAFSYP